VFEFVPQFLILLKTFRVLGEMVGVTRDGTNDDPLLKKVQVGTSASTSAHAKGDESKRNEK